MFFSLAYFCALFVKSVENINTSVRSLTPTCFLSPTILSPIIHRNTCIQKHLQMMNIPLQKCISRPEVDLFLVHLAHSPLIPHHPCCLIKMLCSTNSTFQDPHQADRSRNYLVHAIYRASFLSGIWNFLSVLRFIFFGLLFVLDCWIQVTGILACLYHLLFNLLFSYN